MLDMELSRVKDQLSSLKSEAAMLMAVLDYQGSGSSPFGLKHCLFGRLRLKNKYTELMIEAA